MTKSRSSTTSTDVPLLRWLEARGVPIPDDTAGELGFIRDYLAVAGRQFKSLDQKSQDVMREIYTDMTFAIGSVHMRKAIEFYLAEVEKEETNV